MCRNLFKDAAGQQILWVTVLLIYGNLQLFNADFDQILHVDWYGHIAGARPGADWFRGLGGVRGKFALSH